MIIDSVFWIAVKYKKDKFYNIAKNLIPDFLNLPEIFVTDYVINEVYAFLLRKGNHELALEALNLFTTYPKINILFNSKHSFKSTLPVAQKYTQLSIVDANLVYFARKLKKPILTFEKYLNSIKDNI